jgi:hypothetical protein
MPVADWKTFKTYWKIWLEKKTIIRISYKKSHDFLSTYVLCKFLRFIEKKKYICLIPNPLSRKRLSTKSHHGLQDLETHTTKRSPSSLWNNTVYTTRYLHCICEVKLKIIIETHELPDRLPVWRNKQCGPCFCCVVRVFPIFSVTLYDGSPVWQVAVQSSSRSVFLWSIRTKQSINSKLHLMPRQSDFFALKNSWSLDTIELFVERNWSYAMETHLCGHQLLFLNLFFF